MVRSGIALIITCVILLVTGCLNGQRTEPIVLSINFSSDREFYQKYGQSFENKYPHITVKVIEHDSTDSVEVPDSDVIFFDSLMTYQRYIEEGKLLSLDQTLIKNKYPMSEMPQVITRSLRSYMDNAYYGLSPSFTSYALFYNKDLFESYGVDMPINQMSWKELLRLASQFPKYTTDNERLYGFESSYYTSIAIAMVLEMGKTEGLRFIDYDSYELQLDSAEWKDIMMQVIQAYRSDGIYEQVDSMNSEFAPSPLLTGKAAMGLQSYSMIYNSEANSEFQGGTSMNWGMVTAPVSTYSRDESIYYDIHEIYAISSKTKNVEEAWQLIEYITTDKQNMKSNFDRQPLSGLPADRTIIQDPYSQELNSFYMLKPTVQRNNPYDYIHHDIINAFKEVGEVIMQEAIDDKITVDEAIDKLESEGQKAVNMARDIVENDVVQH